MNNSRTLQAGVNFEEVSAGQLKFYWITAIFAVANVALPALLHLFPMGGMMFLPIYFFTLVAGYKFGWKVGATTAIASALVSFSLTGMPPLPVLPFVIFKGFLLGLSAGVVAKISRWPLLLNLVMVVFLYQLGGSIFEWFVLQDMKRVLSDITIGYIGLALQVFGGAVVISALDSLWKKNH
jgi:hypothetical protein